MKKLKKLFSKIKISKITIFIFLLSFVTGRFVPLFIYFLIAFIHELFHVITAYFFKVNINKINILPFGMMAELDFLDKIHPLKSILILLAGPCSYFLSLILINISYNIKLLSYITYQNALETNKIILFFNLLPIWPLDGGKLVYYILSYIFPLKKVYKLISFISLIVTLILVFLTLNDPQVVIIMFLVLSQIRLLYEMNFNLNKIYIFRLSNEVKYKTKLHDKLDLYLPYYNYYQNETILLNEKELISKIFLYNKNIKK